MSESILVPKSKIFAIRILKCCDYLDKTKIRHALVDQVVIFYLLLITFYIRMQ